MNLQHDDSSAAIFGSSSSNDDSDFNERHAVTSKVVKMSTGDESNPYKEIESLKRKLKKMEKKPYTRKSRKSRRDNDSTDSSTSVSRSIDRNINHRTSFIKLKVPIFTGDYEHDKYDFHGWKERAETYLKRIDASSSDKIAALKMAIQGNAGRLLHKAKINKISDVFKILKPAYHGFQTADQLFHIRQEYPKENVMQLNARILAQARNSNLDDNPKHFDELRKKSFETLCILIFNLK